jgi:hypothetical protein
MLEHIGEWTHTFYVRVMLVTIFLFSFYPFKVDVPFKIIIESKSKNGSSQIQ